MDHYQVLGVSPQADRDEIRAAYLQLMRAHHPDHRPDDPASAEQARRANAAWEVLGSGAKRASYDRQRAAASGARPAAAPAVRRGVTPAVRRGVTPAYSTDRRSYRRAFSVACLKVAAAVCLLGLVLLTTFTA